jgi:hypothetical protein
VEKLTKSADTGSLSRVEMISWLMKSGGSITGRQFVRATMALSREGMRNADGVHPGRLTLRWYISTPGELAPVKGIFLGPRYRLLRLATPMLSGSRVLHKPRQ